MTRFTAIFISLAIGVFASANTSQTQHVQIAFNENDFIFTYDDNGALEINSERSVPLYDNNDAPGMPMLIKEVAVPAGRTFKDFKINFNKRLVKSDVDIAPNPLILTTNFSGVIPRNRVSVCTDSIYPSSNCMYEGESSWTNFTTLYIRTCPFIYNVNERKLYFIDTMDIDIEMKNRVSDNYNMRNTRRNAQIEEMAFNRLENPEAVKVPFKAALHDSIPAKERIEYVIITNEALRESFEPLAKWKKTKGVPSKIITMEEIEANYTGDRPQMKLKNCLKDLYDNHCLKYVLLGGDGSVVPIQGCYGDAGKLKNIDNGESELIRDYSIPTDLFYACFDKTFDWDGNENGIIGEYDDNVDMMPNVYISRLPVSLSFYSTPFVNKIITYEQSPTYSNKMLMGGCHMSAKDFAGEHSDVECWGDEMYSRIIAPNWNGQRIKFYDTATDLEGGASYDFIEENVEEQMSKDYDFISISTHGSEMIWKAKDGDKTTYYSSMNAGHRGQGNGHVVITTTACTTNAFDNYYSWGESKNVACLGTTLVQNPYQGALSYLGCSRASIFRAGSKVSGLSFEYAEKFYNYLFADSATIDKNYGLVVAKAKADLVPKCTGIQSEYRWIQYGLNPLGDPEMPIFTSTPQTFSDLKVETTLNSIIIDSGVDNCRICVMSKDDDGASYYEVAENVKSAEFSLPSKDLSICITKQNYIPSLTSLTIKNLYNQTIEGAHDDNSQHVSKPFTITADVIRIGQGTKLEHGKTHLDCEDVRIYNDVTISDGADLTIGKTMVSIPLHQTNIEKQ